MGKIIIDTPDASYYYCGNCAEKVSYNHAQCSNCKKELKKEKSFQVSSDFEPSLSIIEQLNIFETAEISDGSSNIKTTKKLQLNSEGASFFYCKNCNEAINRTSLQCPNCNSYFSSIINIDSAPSDISSKSEGNPFEDLNTYEPTINHSTGKTDVVNGQVEKGNSTFNYIGFWKRVFAYLLDMIILWILSLFVGGFLGLIFITFDIGFTEGIFHLLGFLVSWIYFAWWESSEQQATIGKRAINAKVVDNKGERLSFANASGRYFSKILSGLLFGFGFLMVAFTEKKQGLHDYLADTRVISNSL